MPRQNWEKIGATIGFLGLLVGLFFSINQLVLNDTQRYFGFTLVLLLAIFGYFNWFKEYPIRQR
jgi:hypothetical protein